MIFKHKTAEKLRKRLQTFFYAERIYTAEIYLEFPKLSQPIYDFVVSEFASEKVLVGDITLCLSDNNHISEDLATNGCQIGQSVVAQLDEELQIPPDVLFKHLSFTHFALLLPVEDPIARVFYELETIKGTWTKRELKRQIDTNYYIRLLEEIK